MKELLAHFLNFIKRINPRSNYEHTVLKFLEKILSRLYEEFNNLNIIEKHLYLKLIMETIIQLKYFVEKYGTNDERIDRELHLRSRKGQSFSIRMLVNSKHLAGRIKREILETYLDICSFVHPSHVLISSIVRESKEYEKILKYNISRTIDYCSYILMLIFGKDSEMCKICIDNNLPRCSKYCTR